MGRSRRKKKTTQPLATPTSSGDDPPPKTFVMERGKVGNVLSQLILNIRQVMEPNTATRLKVRQKNVLKDFVQVAGPLGVTHFIIVSRTEDYINLRICRIPHGPTLTFHIKSFSLGKEVLSSQRDPVSTHLIYMSPPLLVQSGFSSEDKSSKLMSTVFQNIFPSINPQTVKLADTKRCLLLKYNAENRRLEFRHYAIRVKPRGLSRGVRKLAKSHIPDLSRYNDISEYVLGDGGSDSEGEDMGGVGDVTLPQDLPGRGNTQTQQSIIKLSELGPRMNLELVKIESGLCGGEVLFHSFVRKSKSDVRTLKRLKDDQRIIKAERRRQQELNVARKKVEKELHKERCLAGMSETQEVGVSSEETQEVGVSSEDDDTEWYRQEVGQEPDPDTFMSSDGPQKKIRGILKRRMSKTKSKESEVPRSKRAKFSKSQTDKKENPRGATKFTRKQTKLTRPAGRVFRKKKGKL